MSRLDKNGEVKCQIPCDGCGATPARWFGRTSVAVCGNPECWEREQKRWESFCAEMEAERVAEEEW